jgi:hypothetical protein
VLVATDDGSPLRVGVTARAELRVFASTAWATEQVDLFSSTNPGATTPTWQHVVTLKPVKAGAQVLVAALPLKTAGSFAIRARLHHPDASGVILTCGTAGGTNVIDDQDDLAFTPAPWP